MKNTLKKSLYTAGCVLLSQLCMASSHGESPLLTADPMADNIDLYAFKSPCDSNKIVFIANFIPFEYPGSGANWYTFGENIRYEIHVDNNTLTNGDDIIYRFTFQSRHQDSSTIFHMRMGKENMKTTYKLERSTNGGSSFVTIVTSGTVPPPNIGTASVSGYYGMAAQNYDSLMLKGVTTAATGEKVFCGQADDPYFADLGGMFDAGGFRTEAQGAKDGLAKFNCHSIVLEVPVSTLQKSGKSVSEATNILDPNYVIGVWASTSRPAVTTLSTTGDAPTTSGNWIQVSRIGMPLANTFFIPMSMKDAYNRSNPYTNDAQFAQYYKNPELALYMDTSKYASSFPGLSQLRVQTNSLGGYDFRNTKSGLYVLKNTTPVAGSLLDDNNYGTILLTDNTSPRSVDLFAMAYTGIPNMAPYQVATGKNGNPFAAGKPIINNFLPTQCEMLRLNMAVPATPRNDPNFSALGLLKAMELSLTNAMYTNSNLQFVPNMDGFPNGRRLEDDVNTIQLQNVSGLFLAGLGFWYDDYNPNTSTSFITANLQSVMTFNAGVTHNDTTFRTCMPYVQTPWAGFNGPSNLFPVNVERQQLSTSIPPAVMTAFPNPFTGQVSFKYKLAVAGEITIDIFDISGRLVQRISEGKQTQGEYITNWKNAQNLTPGSYFATIYLDGTRYQSAKLLKVD